MGKPLKCDLCDESATVHLTQIINNQIHKIDLCEACAESKGITDPNGYSIADLLINPETEDEATVEETAANCPTCGYSQREFKKTGRLGCPSCYDAFSGIVKPALTGMHKGEAHKGKVPNRAAERQNFSERLQTLESDLQQAIESERYEDAARCRDEILELKKSIAEEAKENV
ncbi:MAG: UvrB/UvrC motif-containing protein [Verrucomicrobiota bacterium]